MNQIVELKPSLPNALNVDKAAVKSLMHTTGLELEEKLTREFDLQGLTLAGPVSEAMLIKAEAELVKSMEPADEETLARAVLKLRGLTSHRNNGKDLDVILEAYVEKLRQYPKDAVLESLDKLADDSEWFPSWSNMRADIEWRCKRRLLAMQAIQQERQKKTLKAVRNAAS